MNGTDNNLIAKWILDAISETIPRGLFHPCPYFGEFVAYNVSLAVNAQMSQFLKGRYKAHSRFYDDKDDNIFSWTLGLELT